MKHKDSKFVPSATWRWTQAFLTSFPVRLFFGGLIRLVSAAYRPGPIDHRVTAARPTDA